VLVAMSNCACSFVLNLLIILIIRLHRMHEMLTIVTDVRGVSLSRGLNRQQCLQCMPHAVCTGSFGAAFDKLLRPLVVTSV